MWAGEHTRIELIGIYCVYVSLEETIEKAKHRMNTLIPVFSILRTIKPNIKYKCKFFGINS